MSERRQRVPTIPDTGMIPPSPVHLRGTGRTTRQLQSLKKGGIYLLLADHEVRYARNLAGSLGLGPFAFMTVQNFLQGDVWRSARYQDFDIDHRAQEGLFVGGQTYARLAEILRYMKTKTPDATFFKDNEV